MSRAVVVGSGPNGLAAALTLAAAGLSVTVYEAADRLGGGCRSAELTLPGLIHDECAAAHPLAVDNAFVRELGLVVEWCWPAIQYAHPLDGGRGAVAFRTLRDTLADLRVPRWERLFGGLAAGFSALGDDVLGPVFGGVPRHPVLLGALGLRAGWPATAIGRWLGDDRAAGLWAGVAAHAFRPFSSIASSAVGVMLAASAHACGWPVARGGSGAIIAAMAARGRELGVAFETGVTVRALDDLRPFDVAMLDLAPGAAVALCGASMPERVRRGLRRFRHGPAGFKVDFAVEGEVPWAYEPARYAGTVHLGGSLLEIAAAEATVCRGRMPERPFVLVCQQSVADRSRERDGRMPIYAYAHVPSGWPGDATAAIEAQIERFAPGFRERVVGRAVRSVAETEAYNANYVGGDIVTGANDLRQLLFRPRPALDPYSLGVAGVYLCSAATPPGAGAHGMCGYNAARSALRRL